MGVERVSDEKRPPRVEGAHLDLLPPIGIFESPAHSASIFMWKAFLYNMGEWGGKLEVVAVSRPLIELESWNLAWRCRLEFGESRNFLFFEIQPPCRINLLLRSKIDSVTKLLELWPHISGLKLPHSLCNFWRWPHLSWSFGGVVMGLRKSWKLPLFHLFSRTTTTTQHQLLTGLPTPYIAWRKPFL